MKPIIGKFEKQSWIGKDKDTLLIGGAVEDFDATDFVLGMSLDQIRRLEDCEHITDNIGRLYVDHNGPSAVYLTNAICEFFGVINLGEITSELLQERREAWENLPKRRYKVTILRVAYSGAERWVNARSESEARRAALELAGDIDCSHREHHAEYVVSAITPGNRGSNTHT
jgi:hypothetical protein